MLVSVIVPIYNVEAFMSHCAETLLAQTLKDVEYIFVNDATPDGSMAVLRTVIDKHPERKSQIKIIEQSQNKGLPAARNTGLAAATGEYVFHCDSDDFVEPDMLDTLYKEAKAKDADIVWCDWYLSFAQNERYMRQPSYDTPENALRAMLGGGMKFNVWNKLVRRSLYADNKIEFPAGYGMGEDMTMMMLFACANKVAYVPKAFYHYVKTNATAFSNTYSPRHLEELRHNVARIEQFVTSRYGDRLKAEVAFMKLEAKFPFLISSGKRGWYGLWSSWYPEANSYILQNKYISTRSRMLQWCASKGLFPIVWCYYWLVIRFVYGVVYR